MLTDFTSLFYIIVRTSVVYLFMILAFRIFGKRELSQLSISDLVLIVLISNAVQNAMVGDNSSLLGGLTAAVVLFSLNLILGFLMYRFKRVRKLIQSDPVTLIYQGKIIPKNLKDSLLTEDELMAAIREHGVANYESVSLAILEVDGNISVITENGEKFKRTQYKRRRHHKTLQDL